MGRLSMAAKMRAAQAVVGARTLYVGLASARQNGSLVEERDAGYRRQPVSFGPPSDGGDAAVCANVRRIDFPPYDADARAELRWWFLSGGEDDAEIEAWGELQPRFVDGTGMAHYPQPLAGEAPFLMPGDVSVAVGDAEEVS